MVIQAPSGSGKTLLCVVRWAKAALEKRNGESAFKSNDNGRWAVLLLTHSAALAEQTADEVAVEMSSETRCEVVPRQSFMVEGGGLAGHGYVMYVPEYPEVQVHVMTVDELVDIVRSEEFAGRRSELQFRHAVVDEGHEVFSYQPHAWLDGQHRCSDPGEVREVLERALADPSVARVVIFHDKAYQHIGAARPDPVWPDRCVATNEGNFLPVVRNPGPVRDAAVP